MKYKVPELKCLRCGHSWKLRQDEKPRICPKCKSPYWDRKPKHAKLILLFILSMFLIGCGDMFKPLDHLLGSHALANPDNFKGDTYIAYGQSNGESLARLHSPISGDNVQVVDLTGDPEHGGNILTTNATSSVCWFVMGNMIYDRTHRAIRIVNVCVGGTNSDQMATQYFNRVTDAISKYHPKALLFVHGEADSANGFTVAHTYNNLKAMIQGSHGVPWYIALDSFGSTNPRLAQLQIISEGRARQGPDVDAIRGIPGDTTDGGIHLAGPGLDLFGQEWSSIL